MKTTLLSDSELLLETRRLCDVERENTVRLLHLLREVEARALFARSHSSLFDYCVNALGLSEDQAQRRIAAMRVLRSVEAPELIEARVASGELKISQLAQVQTFIRTEKKEARRVVSQAETHSLLESLVGKSSRETERVLLNLSPALQLKRQTEERVRPVTADLTEVKFVADSELTALMEEARGLLAHGANMNPSLSDLFKRALTSWVEMKKREKGLLPKKETSKKNSPPPVKATNTRVNTDESPWTSRKIIPTSRFIRIAEKRQIAVRAQGRCEFLTSSGSRCGSRHALEVHHLLPYALGGENRAENLGLYCKLHNAAQAKLDFPAQALTHLDPTRERA